METTRSPSNGARHATSTSRAFAVDVQRRDDVVIVHPGGELDQATAETLRAALDDIEPPGAWCSISAACPSSIPRVCICWWPSTSATTRRIRAEAGRTRASRRSSDPALRTRSHAAVCRAGRGSRQPTIRALRSGRCSSRCPTIQRLVDMTAPGVEVRRHVPTRHALRRHEERALFARLAREHSPAARDAIVERFLPLAHQLARRYRHTEDIDDLKQVAAIGLVKAISRFDPARGLAFSSFAVPTILGRTETPPARPRVGNPGSARAPRTRRAPREPLERADQHNSGAPRPPPSSPSTPGPRPNRSWKRFRRAPLAEPSTRSTRPRPRRTWRRRA